MSESAIDRIERDLIDITRFREYLDRIVEALDVTEHDLVLNPAQRGARKLLEAMFAHRELTKEEGKGVYGMAQPRLRSNPNTPMSRLELSALLEIYREL